MHVLVCADVSHLYRFAGRPAYAAMSDEFQLDVVSGVFFYGVCCIRQVLLFTTTNIVCLHFMKAG